MINHFFITLVVLAACVQNAESSNKYTVKLKIWDNNDCSGSSVQSETLSNGYCLECDDDAQCDYLRVTCEDGGDTVQLKSYDNDECTNADGTYTITDSAGECTTNGVQPVSFEATCKKDDDDDDSVNTCFHGEELVALESGTSIPIVDVKVGDRIQVLRADSTLGFSDVVFVPHERNMKIATFIELETETMRSVKVTPEHLVLNGACSAPQESFTLTKADEVSTGTCLRTIEGLEKISAINKVQDKGIYTVVAADPHGHIVVNGVVASSFGTSHLVPNLYYSLHRALYQVLPQWVLHSESLQAANMLIGGLFISATAAFRK